MRKVTLEMPEAFLNETQTVWDADHIHVGHAWSS